MRFFCLQPANHILSHSESRPKSYSGLAYAPLNTLTLVALLLFLLIQLQSGCSLCCSGNVTGKLLPRELLTGVPLPGRCFWRYQYSLFLHLFRQLVNSSISVRTPWLSYLELILHPSQGHLLFLCFIFFLYHYHLKHCKANLLICLLHFHPRYSLKVGILSVIFTYRSLFQYLNNAWHVFGPQ